MEATIKMDGVREHVKPSKYHYIDGEWKAKSKYRDGELHYFLCDLTDFETGKLEFNGKTVNTAIINSYIEFPNWFKYVSKDVPVVCSPKLLFLSFHTADLAAVRCDILYRNPPRFWDPICSVSLCYGGNHCVVLQIKNPNWRSDSEKLDSPLRGILEDPSMFIAGIEMEKFTEQVKREWGVRVANPVDLVAVAQKSLGKEGRYKVWRGMGVMDIYDAVIGDIKEIKRKPKELQNFEWLFDQGWTEEMLKFETLEGHLGFEIARRCFVNTGVEI